MNKRFFSRKLLTLTSLAILVSPYWMTTVSADENTLDDTENEFSYSDDILAFPGAEGGGRYTSGGREGEVYIVDTLEDYSADETPIPGSLRDAVSQDNRFIVFNVSGIIDLKDTLSMRNRKNITIAGQTAPGDGITIAGFETNMSDSENIIIRYVRLRPGVANVLTGDSMDAIWGRSMKDIMIDHVSATWGTDETMSLYRAENMTVQWSIIAESLTMSGHTKGRHGYGAIMGGVNTTYHHNLIASHTSRAPRFGGGTVEGDSNDHIGVFDFRNNVIYNWGFNSVYGGGRSNQNMINNYMKAGPGTRASVIDRLIDAGEKDKPGKFYVNGNVMEGNPAISADNSLGIYISEANASSTEIVSTPFEMDGISPEALRTTSAEEAYTEVLDKAGATFPKQDAVDGRIKKEVETGKGRFINQESEVGGYSVESEIRPEDFDADLDGIPDEWELEMGLDPQNPTDSMQLADDGSGYTNIEKYVNSLVDMDYVPVNPEIEILSPHNNQQFLADEEVVITAEVDDPSDIEKVDFFDSNGYIGTVTEAPYLFTTVLEDGTHFLTAQATDVNGYETQATAVAVHVNTETDLENWESVDIGNTPIKGWTSLSETQLTIKGAGKIKDGQDSFHYAYKKMTGNGEVIVKVDEMTPVDHHAFAGIMIRESLETDSKAVAAGLSYTKAYEYVVVDPDTGKETKMYRNPFAAYLVGRAETSGEFDEINENLDSVKNAVESGISLIEDVPFKEGAESLGYYLKLVREGNVFIAYGSPDGQEWIEIGTKEVEMDEEVFVGLAVDSNKVDNQLDNLNTAKFSNFTLIEETIEEETPEEEEPVDEEENPDEEDNSDNEGTTDDGEAAEEGNELGSGNNSDGENTPDEETPKEEETPIEEEVPSKIEETPKKDEVPEENKKVEGEQITDKSKQEKLPYAGVSQGNWTAIGLSLIVIGIGSLIIFKKKAK